MALEPVARMIEVILCFISSLVASEVGMERQLIRPAGPPAASAALARMRVASRVHLAARGWGLATNPLRPLTEMIALNMTVEVGLVEGMRAATTPIGSAVSIIRRL